MCDIEWLLNNGKCVKYCAGQMIPFYTDEEHPKRAMYLLLSGNVEVIKADKCVATVSAGEPFGGFEFFFGQDAYKFRAGADSIVYVITEASFYALARSQPSVLMDILKAAYSTGHTLKNLPAGIVDTSLQAGSDTLPVPPPVKVSKPEPVPVYAKAPAQATVSGGGLFPDGHKQYPGITKPEHAPLLFVKEYTCLFCKKKFPEFRVSRSKLYQSKPMRFDMRRYYRDFDAEWYDVITCPHCYFSAFYTYYNEPKPLLKAKIEAELDAARSCVLLDFDATRDINHVFAVHYLALICASGYIPTARQLRARFWGNLSWLYEDIGDAEMERFAACEAANSYETLYSETHLTPTQEQVTCLTIVGMLYRSGRTDNLKKYLFTAKTIKGGDRAYTRMAEDMIDMLRDKED